MKAWGHFIFGLFLMPLSSLATESGKPVLFLHPIKLQSVNLPDGQDWKVGDEFRLRLGNQLHETGKYIVAREAIVPQSVRSQFLSVTDDEIPPPRWNGSFVPSAEIFVHIDGMRFTTGLGGQRTVYGFDEFHAPSLKNEFPLRSTDFEMNWFDTAFDRVGEDGEHSQVGLDLGDGFQIDLVQIFLGVKYSRYKAELKARVEVLSPYLGRFEKRNFVVTGEGYFWDVVGGYQKWSIGIMGARKGAFVDSFKRAIGAAGKSIEESIQPLPLMARVDHVLEDGTLLVGTGVSLDAQAVVKVGTQYRIHRDFGDGVTIIITDNTSDGSIAKLATGDISQVRAGQIFVELQDSAFEISSQSLRASAEMPTREILLKKKNIKKSKSLEGNSPQVKVWDAFWRTVWQLAELPYRIWRYGQYDRALKEKPDSENSWEFRSKVSLSQWAEKLEGEGVLSLIGFKAQNHRPLQTTGPLVAVIDSGVDYNHSVLHGSIWKNPNPFQSQLGYEVKDRDMFGWDFIGGDPRPFDDGYHGTAVGGLVRLLAPDAQIMPLKVFNPYGITNSSALIQATMYALKHGAKIIVMAWATRLQSPEGGALESMKEIARLASQHDVLVVTAAGDRGDQLAEIPTYPAELSRDFPQILSVTSVDSKDQLVRVPGKFSNTDNVRVQIAAPGESLNVPSPRLGFHQLTSSALSAALVAGWAARIATYKAAWDMQRIRAEVLSGSESVASLTPYVESGRRLTLRNLKD